jgi:hypothetical protein
MLFKNPVRRFLINISSWKELAGANGPNGAAVDAYLNLDNLNMFRKGNSFPLCSVKEIFP